RWKTGLTLAALAAVVLVAPRPAVAGDDSTPVATIIVNEYGNALGTTSQGYLSNDLGPGGRKNALTYNLPFKGTQGDVLLTDQPTGVLGDVIRFNGDGTLIFYSDSSASDPADAPADTVAPPSSFYPFRTTLPEVGNEVLSGAIYTPNEDQPGWDRSG